MELDVVIRNLKAKCVGLTYISEIDSEVKPIIFASQCDSWDVATFTKAANISITPVTANSADDFFQHQIEIHPNQNWNALYVFMAENIPNLNLFICGTTNVEYYIMGLVDSLPVGVAFQAVET